MYRRFICILTLIAIFTSCGIQAAQYSFDSATCSLIHSEDRLYEMILEAEVSCRIILSGNISGGLSNSIVQLTEKGVSVEILLNSRQTNVSYHNAVMYYGNVNSAIQENILLLDNESVILWGMTEDSLVLPVICLDSIMIAEDILSEFEQMAYLQRFSQGNDRELPKQTWAQESTFHASQNSIGILFHPQDDALKHLNRVLVSGNQIGTIFLNEYDNPAFLANVDLLYDNGADFDFIVSGSADENSVLSSCYPWLKSIKDIRFPLNAVFFQNDGQVERVIVWTFSLDQNYKVQVSDGIMLDISGPLAVELYDSYLSASAEAQIEALPQLKNIILAESDVIISEIGYINREGEWRGDFIEIVNLSTEVMDMSACRLIISNANRLSVPDTLSLPQGSLLIPGQCLVVASSYTEYMHVDYIYDLFLYSRGFSVSLVNVKGQVLDIAGDAALEYEEWGGRVYSASRDKSMHRTDPYEPGYLTASWSGSTYQTNVYPTFQSEIIASPGFYLP